MAWEACWYHSPLSPEIWDVGLNCMKFYKSNAFYDLAEFFGWEFNPGILFWWCSFNTLSRSGLAKGISGSTSSPVDKISLSSEYFFLFANDWASLTEILPELRFVFNSRFLLTRDYVETRLSCKENFESVYEIDVTTCCLSEAVTFLADYLL